MGRKKTKVVFADFGPNIASARLRAAIPQMELAKLGYRKGNDILIYGKHWVTMQELAPFPKVVFDVCDDHFDSPEFGDYYREHIAHADVVTCNTPTMRQIIHDNTGADPIVIPDPYEAPEKPPGIGDFLLWFGHLDNLKHLTKWQHLGVKVLTEPEWTMERQRAALSQCKCVLIPTGRKKGKSANRLIETVRNGRFVIADDYPSHDEFKPFMWIGKDPAEGIEWLDANRGEALDIIRACQDYVRNRYSPATVALQWVKVIEGLS